MEPVQKAYKSIATLRVELVNLESNMNELQTRADIIKLDLERISREIEKIKSRLNKQ